MSRCPLPWRAFVASCALLVLSGCNQDNPLAPPPADGAFEVRVVDPDGHPVVGATLEAGFDWTWSRTVTDAEGRAKVPGRSYNKAATVARVNYFPTSVHALGRMTLVLRPTPRTLEALGPVEGEPVLFKDGRIVSVLYQGQFRTYSYDAAGVRQVAGGPLPRALTGYHLSGDSLWLATFNEGVYLYSLVDLAAPRFLLHLAIDGYLGPLAAWNDLLAVGNPQEPGPIRLFSHASDGSFRLVGQAESFRPNQMYFLHYSLVVIGNHEDLPTVVDVSTPRTPRVAYRGLWSDVVDVVPLGDRVALASSRNYAGDLFEYRWLDIGYPALPHVAESFLSEAPIKTFVDAATALGAYGSSVAVLRRDGQGDYHAVAMAYPADSLSPTAGNGDYFLVGGQLWHMN